MRILRFFKRPLSRYADNKTVRDFERVVNSSVTQDNQRPFATDLKREEIARNEYLDVIGYPSRQ